MTLARKNFPGTLGLVVLIGVPLLLLWRLVFRRSIQHTRRHGHLREGVIIAGNARHIDDLAAVLRRESWLGYTVLGALTTPGSELIETPAGIPILGTSPDAIDLAEDRERFARLVDKLGLRQPANGIARSRDEAAAVAR